MPYETSDMSPILKVKLQTEASRPAYYKNNGGLKLFSAESMIIEPGQIKLISSQLAMELVIEKKIDITLEQITELTEKGLYVANNPGTIDMDYRGMIKVILWNFSNKAAAISPGDLIGRLGFYRRIDVKVNVESNREYIL
jgi:dUTPase